MSFHNTKNTVHVHVQFMYLTHLTETHVSMWDSIAHVASGDSHWVTTCTIISSSVRSWKTSLSRSASHVPVVWPCRQWPWHKPREGHGEIHGHGLDFGCTLYMYMNSDLSEIWYFRSQECNVIQMEAVEKENQYYDGRVWTDQSRNTVATGSTS